METVKCNLCGSNDAILYLKNWDWMLNKDLEFSLVQCQSCGLIYINPRPTTKEMMKFYPDSYGAYSTNSNNPLFKWMKQEFWKSHIAYLRKFVDGNARILEVGCGSGEYLAFLRDNGGWQVQGIEFSPFAAEKARQDYSLDVKVGSLVDVTLPEVTYDVVIMKYVLEHVPDPYDTVKKVSQVLKPGGIFFFIIPNMDSWEVKAFGKYWNGYDTPRHLSLYGKETLAFLLQKCNMDILSIRYTIIPNDIIESIRYFLEDNNGLQFLSKYFRSNNLGVIGLISPLSFLMGKLRQSGGMEIIAQLR
jgi:SAM-dependent methyltransferase